MCLYKIAVPYFAFFLLALSISCAKDSDLLSEVIFKNEEGINKNILLNDFYNVQPNTTTVLDVLANDNIVDTNHIEIIKTSNPIHGIVIINNNKTLTYIPAGTTTPEETTSEETTSEETTPEETTPEETTPEETTPEETSTEETTPQTDSFTYTVEVTNEDESTTTEEATVTINPVNSEPSGSNFPSGENIFYVTTNGKASNDGKTEATAWNIEKAFQIAKAGEIIYIKNGHYKITSPLTINNQGNQSNPIKIIGYKLIPNDIISVPYSSFNYEEDFFNSNFPLIISSNDKAIDIETNYIKLKNIAVTGKNFGIHIKGSYNLVENCVFADLGTKGNTGYDGFGIIIEGNYNEIINSYGENVASEAFSIWDGSSHNRIAYCDYRMMMTNYKLIINSLQGK